jgi:hypothetical protein
MAVRLVACGQINLDLIVLNAVSTIALSYIGQVVFGSEVNDRRAPHKWPKISRATKRLRQRMADHRSGKTIAGIKAVTRDLHTASEPKKSQCVNLTVSITSPLPFGFAESTRVGQCRVDRVNKRPLLRRLCFDIDPHAELVERGAAHPGRSKRRAFGQDFV